MLSYILRDIDPTLWVRVKARAQQDGLRLRALMLALLRAYADRDVSITATHESTVSPRTAAMAAH